MAIPVAEIAAALLGEQEIAPRARILAKTIADALPDAAVVVFVIEDAAATMWSARAYAGDVSVDGNAIAVDVGAMGAAAREQSILQFSGEDLARDEYAWLDVRQNLTGLTCIPLILREQLLGCVAVVSFSEMPDDSTLESLAQLGEIAAPGFAASLSYANERDAQLASVMRLTQLYDIEKVFSASLEMTTLMPVICEKVSDLIRAQAVNLWMVDNQDLLLMQQAGVDPVAQPGDRQKAGGGIVGDVAESDEAILLESGEPALIARNALAEEAPVGSLIAAPVVDGENLVAVIEAIRIEGDSPFTDDDLFVLTQVASSAAQALHNSSLLQAERKIEILQTLVSVGQEISSTLNQDRVLHAIVNQPQLVIPYERAAIALEQRNRLTIKAISGVTKLDTSEPSAHRLQEVLRWAAGLDTEIQVSMRDDEISDDRPETREKFRRYFEESGYRGFYAVPLSDDEGRLGMLSFESADPDFLTELHIEVIKLLASQATLALRNASLYKEVPFIGILEPLMEKKRRFMAVDRQRRALILTAATSLMLALVTVPVPMRVSAGAEVAPGQTESVRAEEDGVIQTVLVHEGERVSPGTPLVQMADWGQRAAAAAAEARYNTAMAQMSQALVNNDATLAGQRQLEAQVLRGELTRARDELDRTTVRAAMEGIVETPHPENLAGRKVAAGDSLLDLIRTSESMVDVAIPQQDVTLVQAGDPASIKLESFPTQTFRGTVSVVSPAGEVVGEDRVFYARIAVPNPDGSLRPGMQGFSKIHTGLRPLGYVMFRDIAVWTWAKLWTWFGW
ncbi:MAG TPA: GAF domain-containing protein [Acidobacteriaceae bacterium]|nr:GAF domain-containing protein [Acidobacteriaceae bacterium]